MFYVVMVLHTAVRESIYNDINLTRVVLIFKKLFSVHPSSLDLFIFIIFFPSDL